jgi:hypothetical protein
MALSGLLLASGCYHGAQVKAVQLTEPGTYVVATPGALSLAQQSGSAQRICTMRLPPGHAKGKGGKHAKRGSHAESGKRGKRGGPAWQGPPAGAHGPGAGGGNAGGPALLDTLMFRLCEARSNGDITQAQYQELLKGMLELAKERAAAPRGPFGPAMMDRPMRRPGMGPGMGPGMRPGGRGGWGPGRGPDSDGSAGDSGDKTPDEPKKPDGKPKGK